MAKNRLRECFAVSAWGIALILSGVAVAAPQISMSTGQTFPQKGVLKVRFGGDRAQTRIVIDLDHPTPGGDVITSGPNILIAPLPKISAPAQSFGGYGQGLVRHWQVERVRGQTRLTLDIGRGVVVSRRFILAPGEGVDHWRYVIDLDATGAAKAQAIAAITETKKSPAPVVLTSGKSSSAGVVRISSALKKHRRVVVIDAGHGGKDPGARGNRTQEKDVTLAAAKALKKRLEASGSYKVVLTRDSDIFVPLEQRVAIARKVDADLFISLHADSGPDAATRGASVYTLSEKGADRVAKVLGPQGLLIPAHGPGKDQAVSQILFDLTQRSTKNRSAVFAETLLDHVGEQTLLLRRSHRDAGFVVLLAPEVPAVLLEMGFITSLDDERLLTSPDQRVRLVDAIGHAIDAFFAGQQSSLGAD